jgi:hypothetical protein
MKREPMHIKPNADLEDVVVSEYPTITLSGVHATLAHHLDKREEVDREVQVG